MHTFFTFLTALSLATSALADDAVPAAPPSTLADDATSAATAPTAPTTSTEAEAPVRPRVLVLEPSSTAFDDATVATITGLMIVELSNERRLDVISAAEVQRLAELEGEKQSAGCADTSCLAELAGAMGARYVVFGDVGQLGSLVVMNLNLFDSQTAQAISRVTVQADGITALPAALPARMKLLSEPLLAEEARQSGTPTPLATVDTTEPTTGGSITPWILMGGGAAVALVALAVDVFSPTSQNGEFDGVDVVGPVGYVAGAGAGIVGVALLVFGGDDEEP